MTASRIRLDRALPYSECRGERMPEDPHYKVHFFQPYKIGKKLISLPFDAHGNLIADDGRKESYSGVGVEGKPVTYSPLYTEDMRVLVAKLEEKQPVEDAEDDDPVIAGSENADAVGKHIDLAAWLRGETTLHMAQVRAACKAQRGINPQSFAEAVNTLVLDEGMIPVDQLKADFKRYLPKE